MLFFELCKHEGKELFDTLNIIVINKFHVWRNPTTKKSVSSEKNKLSFTSAYSDVDDVRRVFPKNQTYFE